MVGWIVGLSIILLLVLLLFSSIRLKISYREEKFSVAAAFWFFRFPLYPPKPKKKKTGTVKTQAAGDVSEKKQTQEQKEKKLSLDFILLLVKSAWKGLRVLFRHLRVTGLKLHVIVGNEDAAECALLYGKISACLNGGLAAAKSLMAVQVKDITLDCDFGRKDLCIDGSCAIQIRTIFLFGAVASMLYYFIVNTIEEKNSNRKV